MAEYDLNPELELGQKPRAKEPQGESRDAAQLSRAIEHGRPEALGAAAAMHLQRAAGNAAMGSLVQRSTDEESPVHKVVGKGGGSALDDGVRTQMETSFGHDFSGVRVHTGSDAATAAKSVQAQAFTVGHDVVFNDGKYAPSSPTGRRTIAHELTHVVQQRQGSVPGEPAGGGVKVSDPGDWAERQAEATADAVMADPPAADHTGHSHEGAPAPAASVQTLPLQRQAGGENDDVQALHDPAVQREGEEEEEVQTLQDTSVQREGEEEEEALPA